MLRTTLSFVPQVSAGDIEITPFKGRLYHYEAMTASDLSDTPYAEFSNPNRTSLKTEFPQKQQMRK